MTNRELKNLISKTLNRDLWHRSPIVKKIGWKLNYQVCDKLEWPVLQQLHSPIAAPVRNTLQRQK